MAEPPWVTVVGYLSLDHIDCPAGRFHEVPGGAALYSTLGARAAGANVRLVARVTEDFPHSVLRTLAAIGIDIDGVERAAGPIRRARLLERTGAEPRQSPHHGEENWWERTAALAPPLPNANSDAYVFGPMPAPCLTRQLAARRAEDVLLVADTSAAFALTETSSLLALIEWLDLFAPSQEETRLLFPALDDSAAAAALAALCPRIVQKRGAEGLYLCGKSWPSGLLYSSRAHRVIDTTGAGDASVGALATGLVLGLDGERLLELATRVGAQAVSGIGPAAFGIEAPLPAEA